MRLHVEVGPAPFDLAMEEQTLLQGTDAGATVAFVGRVRGNDGAKPLQALILEHYPGVTEAEISRLASMVGQRWPLLACKIIHRVGRLLPGETIVLVLVAASHRQAAFSAAECLMDYLKTDAPFWKREEFVDGSSHWVEARQCDQVLRQRWQAHD